MDPIPPASDASEVSAAGDVEAPFDDAATSLAEALSESADDDERVRRIHYLIDEAYPPDPSLAQLQEPDEARLAVWSIVPHLDPATFDRYWSAIVHAAALESAFALDLSATRWVWAAASDLIVDQADYLAAEPADHAGAGPGTVFLAEAYTDALREAWSRRRGAEVQALVGANREVRHPFSAGRSASA